LHHIQVTMLQCCTRGVDRTRSADDGVWTRRTVRQPHWVTSRQRQGYQSQGNTDIGNHYRNLAWHSTAAHQVQYHSTPADCVSCRVSVCGYRSWQPSTNKANKWLPFPDPSWYQGATVRKFFSDNVRTVRVRRPHYMTKINYV